MLRVKVSVVYADFYLILPFYYCIVKDKNFSKMEGIMNLYKLKYFIITAEELNISKAAERLFISQQALSSQINQLEEYYGVKLFQRKPSFTLTYAGSCLLAKARLIIDLENEIEADMDSISRHRKGTLKIGVSYARGNLLAAKIIPLYHKTHPGIELKLVEGSSKELCSYLEHKTVDFIIDFAPILLDNVTIVNLQREQIYMIVPEEIKNNFLTDSSDTNLLLKAPMLLLPKGNYVRNIIEQVFFKHNIAPNVIIESKNIDTLCSLCRQGMGITFCSEMYAASLKDTGNLSRFPMADESAYGQLVIAYQTSHVSASAIKGFIKLATDYLTITS